MTLPLNWKIVLTLCAIFAAGAGTGSFITLRSVDTERKQRAAIRNYAELTIQKLRKELDLNPSALEPVKPHVEEAGKKLQKEYDQTLKEIERILDEMSAAIEPELDPDQVPKFKQLIAQAKKRLKRQAGSG